MFGLKTVRAKDYEAQEARIRALEEEVKGYYENTGGEVNEYFRAIAPLLKGLSIRDVFSKIGRDDLRNCYETCAPAYGIINKIAKAVGEMFTYLELQRKDNGDFVDKHFILDMLNRPNDRYNTQRFGQAWAVNRLIYGDAFVYTIKAVGAFHDRFLILDGTELYHFGASLKDLGRQYCAVTRMDAMFIPSILRRI